MYNKIFNPTTGKNVNVNSKLGKQILKKYLEQLGGHIGPCAKGKSGRCVKSKKADSECEVSPKGWCKVVKIKKTKTKKKKTKKGSDGHAPTKLRKYWLTRVDRREASYMPEEEGVFIGWGKDMDNMGVLWELEVAIDHVEEIERLHKLKPSGIRKDIENRIINKKRYR